MLCHYAFPYSSTKFEKVVDLAYTDPYHMIDLPIFNPSSPDDTLEHIQCCNCSCRNLLWQHMHVNCAIKLPYYAGITWIRLAY